MKPIARPDEQRPCRDCGKPFVAGAWARFCPTCRPLHRKSKATKYRLDGETIELLKAQYDSRIPNRVAAIARQLGWPSYAVKRAAKQLGLATPWPAGRKTWSAEELAVIREWAGLRSPHWIARKLRRSETSVTLKMKRLRISQRITNGYGLREVAECFGVDHHQVDRWIERGWLRRTVDGPGRNKGWTRFSDDAIRAFVRSHPLEFRLDKVDQVWFVGLLLGNPLIDEEGVSVQPREIATQTATEV